MVFLHTRTTPIYLLPAGYVLLALIFPDRWQYLYGLLLALVLYLGSNHLGKQLSFLLFKTADPTLYLPLGLGSLLLICYPAFAFTTASTVFWIVWGVLALLALREWEILRYRLPRRYLLAAPFVLLAIWSTFTPSIFFDALVYHIGLPHQYLAAGQMKILPNSLYSAFPPFDQVLNLLFIGMKSESGIKVFSIVIYFHLISALASLLRWILSDRSPGGGNGHDQMFSPPSTRGELLVIPMLILPTAWIQIHLHTADLLVALFFCSAIATLIKEFDFLSTRKLFTVSLLFAFGIWTKWATLLYVALFVFLWLPLHGWRPSKYEWKRLAIFYFLVLLCVAPLLVRNYIALGDPLYPALSGIFPSGWGKAQAIAIQHDSFPAGASKLELLLAPLLITFQIKPYGSASEIGLILLITLILYPFAARNRMISRIGLYVLVCYLLWLTTLHNFRHFFPVFLLTFLMTYISLRFLDRFPKAVAAALIVCGLFSAYQLVPIYTKFFPLISSEESSNRYLESSIAYYPLAAGLPEQKRNGKVLLVGDTRTAYFKNELIAPTAYDHHPLEDYIVQSNSPDEILRRFRSEKIDYILFSLDWFVRFTNKFGIWPTDILPSEFQKGEILFEEKSDSGIPLRKLPAEKKKIWQQFISKHAYPLWRHGDYFVVRIGQ